MVIKVRLSVLFGIAILAGGLVNAASYAASLLQDTFQYNNPVMIQRVVGNSDE